MQLEEDAHHVCDARPRKCVFTKSGPTSTPVSDSHMEKYVRQVSSVNYTGSW